MTGTVFSIGFILAMIWLFREARRQRRDPLPQRDLGDPRWFDTEEERVRRWQRLIIPTAGLLFCWPVAFPILVVLRLAGYR